MNLTQKELRTVPLKDLHRIKEIRQRELDDDFKAFKAIIVAGLITIGLLMSICLVMLFSEEIDKYAYENPFTILFGVWAIGIGILYLKTRKYA